MAEAIQHATSRVGKRPIPLPKGVSVKLEPSKVLVKGPKGSLTFKVPENVAVAQKEQQLHVSSDAPGRNAARLQGMARALIDNMVHGVAHGYQKRLELHGTGYRAEVQGNIIHCSLGFSHPVDFPIPEGITVEIPKDSKGALIILDGPDKAVVGQTAATLRSFRPPEPYGGKGVRYQGERVREKAGKAGK